MNCDQCGQPDAQVRYTEVVGTQKQMQWLCSGCAAEHGLILLTGSAGPGPITPAPVPTKAEPERVTAAALRRRCPNCDTNLSAIRRTGRVGCPTCYDTFRTHLEPLLMRVHRCLEHIGHRRGSLEPEARSRQQLLRLRGDLQRAVDDEDFETAARLRDQIRIFREALDEEEASS